MPNYIKNRLTIKGDQKSVASFFESIKAPEGHPIDFERIITPPDNLFRDNLGDAERAICELMGQPNWYDWNTENWGTKWNAMEGEVNGNVLTFETAWACPVPIVHKIAKMFPDLEIIWEYADEDTGSNTGSFILRGGKAFYHAIKNQSIEAYEMAFSLRPDRKDDYKLVNGRYEYTEE